MSATKLSAAAVVPAAIVLARFVIPESSRGDLWQLFAVVSFFATLLGCSTAAFLLRSRIHRLSLVAVAVVGALVAAILLALFPTMPSWPFTGVGFIAAWIAMAFVFTAAFLYLASSRFAQQLVGTGTRL